MNSGTGTWRKRMLSDIFVVDTPEGRKKTYDVSGLIRSEDMKKLMKEARPVLTLDDVEQIILYSDYPVDRKMRNLRTLSLLCDIPDQAWFFYRMADMLDVCMQQIYFPKERVLYIWQRAGEDHHLYFDSLDDLMHECMYHPRILTSDHVTQLYVGREKSICRLTWTMQWINRQYVVRAIQPNVEWLREKKISELLIRRYWAGLDLSTLGIHFPEGERWKYQTPSMKEPAYGEFRNSPDGQKLTFCRLNMGFPDYEFDGLDADHSGDMYSILDWFEKAPEEDGKCSDMDSMPFE